MNTAYEASFLPLDNAVIDQKYFFEELIDATTKLEVYKEKIKDSKLDSSWFMPTLQQKEALASSQLDGTPGNREETHFKIKKKEEMKWLFNCF